jgi:hypothetical protein
LRAASRLAPQDISVVLFDRLGALPLFTVDDDPILSIEVNEQNLEATQFYVAHGFAVVRRSDLDLEGRPFPLLRMRESVE